MTVRSSSVTAATGFSTGATRASRIRSSALPSRSTASSRGASTTSRARSRPEPFRDAYLEPFPVRTTRISSPSSTSARRLGWLCRAVNGRIADAPDEARGDVSACSWTVAVGWRDVVPAAAEAAAPPIVPHRPEVPCHSNARDRQAGRRHPVRPRIEDIVVGDGDEATSGHKSRCTTSASRSRTGEEFDASWNRGQPFEFKLGKGQVIPGWDAGVQGMRVGGRRKLTIPSAMAYGARGAGGVIAPHEPLVFVVDCSMNVAVHYRENVRRRAARSLAPTLAACKTSSSSRTKSPPSSPASPTACSTRCASGSAARSRCAGTSSRSTATTATSRQARAVVDELVELVEGGHAIGPDTVGAVAAALDQSADIRDIFDDVVWRHRGKKIAPKTVTQKKYVDSIRSSTVTFGIGPAGTGKTYLAIALAVAALSEKQVGRLILTRPAVEAGERLGFLPGDMLAKVDPYMRPLFDALYDTMDPDRLTAYMERGTIEVAPLAFMRGRTLNDSFIILDEAQNTTPEQMQMFLTRLGFGSKMVITGDITQVDLPREQASGLIQVRDILRDVDGIGVVEFGHADVVRHKLVQRIVEAYKLHADETGTARKK